MATNTTSAKKTKKAKVPAPTPKAEEPQTKTTSETVAEPVTDAAPAVDAAGAPQTNEPEAKASKTDAPATEEHQDKPNAENKSAAKKAAIKEKIDELVKKHNVAVKLAHGRMAEEIKSEIDKKVSEYATEARLDFGYKCRKSSNPMAKALQMLTYTVVKTRIKKDDDTKLDLMSAYEDERFIDLMWLHGYIDGGIGVDKSWVSKAVKFNKEMSSMTNNALAKPIKDFEAAYKISSEADAEKGFKSGKGSSINSKDENLMNDVKIVVKAMIGDAKLPLLDTVLVDAKAKKDKVTYGNAVAAYLIASHTTRKRGRLIDTTKDKKFVEALAIVCADMMYAEKPGQTLMMKLGQANKKR